ncbi:MAG: NAD(P)/FAD-dependent oxidoreductase [Polyangiaceae bacterium]|nr:NAD(P)/FAD-dependent oxidoreductase [Polyangiaceae bacterium]
MQSSHVDVLVVGAGLSGVGAGYYIQSRLKGRSYVILEARDTMGGTWDLFRYPGIRSDSDMHTLGYAFRPWTSPRAIADGSSILQYIRDTASAYGVDRHIRYRHAVEKVSWSSRDARWTVTALDKASGERGQLTARFIYSCTGYYDYEEGYTPDFPGMKSFRGRVVHPQKWGPDVDYAGKRVVVIGSGATAVTLVPELAKQAAHVTMLQRSPTYILSLPGRDAIAEALKKALPSQTAYDAVRWKNVLIQMGFYNYCRRFPEHAKGVLVSFVERHLKDQSDVREHFTPSYGPWDQRLCVVPDSDLFRAIKHGTASVVTGHIRTFTERGIELESGRGLEADLVVTATGLKLKCMGGVACEIDGRPVSFSQSLVYKGMMCSDVPNLAFATGYTNASWTLKCDLTSEYVCRLIRHMDQEGFAACTPRRRDPSIEELPLIDFSSGYVQRGIDQFPRQGSAAPWRLYQNYALDLVTLRHGRVDDPSMEFSKAPA